MGMVVILVETQHHSEDQAAALSAITAVARASRSEHGCISYTVAVDHENPSIIRVSELWAGIDEHRVHMAQPHVTAFFETTRDLRIVRRNLNMFEIDRTIELAIPAQA